MGLSKYLLAGAITLNSLLAQDIAPAIYDITKNVAQSVQQNDSELEAKLRSSYQNTGLFKDAKDDVVIRSHKKNIPLVTVKNLSNVNYAYTQFLKAYINNVMSGHFEALKNGKDFKGSKAMREKHWQNMINEDLNLAANYMFSTHGQGAIENNLKKRKFRQLNGTEYNRMIDGGIFEMKKGGMNVRHWLRHGLRPKAANRYSELVQKSPDSQAGEYLVNELVRYGKHEIEAARQELEFLR